LISECRRFTPHRNTGRFERSCKRVQACRIGDLPPEKALGIRTLLVNDQSLAAVIHAEGPAGSGAVDRLQP
jgi:hypothetical protein